MITDKQKKALVTRLEKVRKQILRDSDELNEIRDWAECAMPELVEATDCIRMAVEHIKEMRSK